MAGSDEKVQWKLRSKALSEPLSKFNYSVKKRKKALDYDIHELERDNERRPGETVLDHYLRWRDDIRPKLHAFYNSSSMKSDRTDLDKASRGERDRALHQLLKLCGTGIGEKHDQSHLIFVLGNADFGHGTWSAFSDYMVEKLKSLGHTVVFEDEWGTSKLSPCCHLPLEFLQGDAKGTRLKYCRHCHIVYNRDPMAGENLSMCGGKPPCVDQGPVLLHMKANHLNSLLQEVRSEREPRVRLSIRRRPRRSNHPMSSQQEPDLKRLLQILVLASFSYTF